MGRALLVFALGACRFSPGTVAGDARDLDGPGLDMPADAPPDALVLGPWGTPTVAISGPADDDPTLTADLLEIYFNRNADIYVATRATASDPWGTPAKIDALSSGSNETTPEITGDGLTIFIASSRTGTLGSDDIWVSTRPDRTSTTSWSTPDHVDELSTTVNDAASAPTDDLRAIVFISTRANGLGAQDIWYSERAQPGDPWGTAMDLGAANSSSDDFSPMLSQDRLTLYFDSPRSGNSELYRATRATTADLFGTPQLIDELNTTGAESDIWVSPDQRHMFFTRDGVLYESAR